MRENDKSTICFTLSLRLGLGPHERKCCVYAALFALCVACVGIAKVHSIHDDQDLEDCHNLFQLEPCPLITKTRNMFPPA